MSYGVQKSFMDTDAHVHCIIPSKSVQQNSFFHIQHLTMFVNLYLEDDLSTSQAVPRLCEVIHCDVIL